MLNANHETKKECIIFEYCHKLIFIDLEKDPYLHNFSILLI